MKEQSAFGYRRLHSGFTSPEVEADTAGRGGRPVVLKGSGAGELLSEKRGRGGGGQDGDACGM